MAESQRQDSISPAKVKDLIFAYERQVSHIEPLEEYYYEGRQRAKSMGNVLSYKNFRQPELKINNILDIEKELVKIEAHLNYYEIYEKDTHVAFQEQLFSVLTNIVSIDPEGHESTIQKKRELIAETQKLATVLNLKLPTDGSHSYRGVRRTYSNAVRREESVAHSSTTLRTQHRAILTTNHSTTSIHGGFQSEESLNSTKDSVDSSSKHGDTSSADFHPYEEPPKSQTPPPAVHTVAQNEVEGQSKHSSSVSRLKRFFSFKRDEKPEIHVTTAAYSGVSRSQSLNLKTSRHVTKRDKIEDRRPREENISETEESNEADTTSLANQEEAIYVQKAKSKENDHKPSLYVETVQDIEEYRDVQTEDVHNVSVSKLKSLFEDNQKETEEGLALLTKKPNVHGSAYDLYLPNAQTNFSPFRLTRTISGNYMNFIGLLRNVDIEKKADLNKSKSLSDLKAASLSYGNRERCNKVDLSQELDGDDDFEQVSFEVGGKSSKSTDSSVEIVEAATPSEQKDIENSEIITGVKVDVLKKTFEEINGRENRDEHKHDNNYVTDRATIEPVIYSSYTVDKNELKSSRQESSNQNEVSRVESLEDVHTTFTHNAHQLSADEFSKGKVETLKKVFDGHDEDIIISNTTENPNPQKYLVPEAKTTSEINILEAQETINKLSIEEESSLKNVDNHEINQFVSNEAEEADDYSAHTEANKNSEHLVEVEQVVTPGIVDALKTTFDNLSTNNVVENHTNQVLTKTVIIEPVAYTTAHLSEEILGQDSIEQTAHVSATHQASIDNAAVEPALYNNSLTGKAELKDNAAVEPALYSNSLTDKAEPKVSKDLDENESNLADKIHQQEPVSESSDASKIRIEDLSRNAEVITYQTVDVTNSNTNQSTLDVATQGESGLVSLEDVKDKHNRQEETRQVGSSELAGEEKIEIVQSKRKTLKLPVELNIESDDEFSDSNLSGNSPSKVPISRYNGNEITTAEFENNAVSEAGFQSKTESFMKILESPSTTLVSGASYCERQNKHVSSSSKVSVSYSQKKTVQHTSSTQVSHRIVSSSSSSQLSSMNYLEVLKEPNSYSTITMSNANPDDDSSVEIVDLDDIQQAQPKTPQDKILEDILKNGDSIENVDEEFEKLLQNN